MKLFVWNDCYGVRYGAACAYAVAETVEQARALIQNAGVSEYGHAPVDQTHGADVSGDPDRICDVPYAEIYQWSE